MAELEAGLKAADEEACGGAALAESEASEGEGSEEYLTPPMNFAMVERGIYRSGFPETRNFSFLDSLGLRSVLYLSGEPYPETSAEFIRSRGIRLFQWSIGGSKRSPPNNSEDTITDALRVLIDSRNHPVLILCKRGKHRAGCIVVGCFRKLQSWSMAAVFEEYRRFAVKTRISDLRFIEELDVSGVGQCPRAAAHRFSGCGSQARRRLVHQEISDPPAESTPSI